jgi:hypothetical protein
MGYSARSIAPEAHDYEPESDDAGLRRTLRDVPILPAPANVDDLLARLDAEVEVASGPLAEIISDARFIEPEPLDDPFFAPILDVANGNVPQPAPPRRPLLASRIATGLFAAGLLVGAALIGRNALTPEAGAPEVVVPVVQRAEAPPATLEAAADLSAASSGALLAPTAAEPEAIAQADGATPASPQAETQTPAEAAQSDETLTAAADAAPSSGEALASAPVELDSPITISSEPVPEAQAEHADAVAIIAGPSASPDDRRAEAEPVELTFSVPSSAEPVVSLPAPAEPVFEDVAEIRQPVAPVEASDLAPPAVAEVVPALPEAASARSVEPEMPVQETSGVSADLPVAAPRPPARPIVRSRAPFAGVWGESREACTPAGQEEGALLSYIGSHSARAGDTTCSFRRIRRTGNSWTMNALCSDGETRWRSNVRLTLRGRSLTWSSEKGSTEYVRCGRR